MDTAAEDALRRLLSLSFHSSHHTVAYSLLLKHLAAQPVPLHEAILYLSRLKHLNIPHKRALLLLLLKDLSDMALLPRELPDPESLLITPSLLSADEYKSADPLRILVTLWESQQDRLFKIRLHCWLQSLQHQISLYRRLEELVSCLKRIRYLHKAAFECYSKVQDVKAFILQLLTCIGLSESHSERLFLDGEAEDLSAELEKCISLLSMEEIGFCVALSTRICKEQQKIVERVTDFKKDIVSITVKVMKKSRKESSWCFGACSSLSAMKLSVEASTVFVDFPLPKEFVKQLSRIDEGMSHVLALIAESEVVEDIVEEAMKGP